MRAITVTMAGGLALFQASAPLAQQVVAEQKDALLVEVVTARPEPVERRLESTGEVVARDAVALAFPIEGRVSEVLVDEGDEVEADQVLARIEATQQEQSLRAAQAGLETAEADGRLAADEFAREESLLANGATTRARRDDAETRLRTTEALVVQARSEVEIAEEELADAALTAPQAGLVTARDIEVGQVVVGAQTVIELAAGGKFDAVFDIPEAAVATTGATEPAVTITLIDGAHPSFKGRVSEISPQVDPAAGTVQVTVAIESLPEGVAYGALVRGGVSLIEAPRISLPAWALAGEGGGAAIWVVDPGNDTVSLRPVTVLRHVDVAVILSAGIADGEKVVGRGAHLMFPGRTVAWTEAE